MGRPAISKTPFGQRLTDVRVALGYAARNGFAALLDMHPDTLGGYERGDSVPDFDFLTMYKRRFGVNIEWLITGEGEMFSKPRRGPTAIENRLVDPDVMRDLAELVQETFKEQEARVRDADLAVEASIAYNDLLSLVADPTDTPTVKAALPLVKRRLEIRLAETAANPQSRKYSA